MSGSILPKGNASLKTRIERLDRTATLLKIAITVVVVVILTGILYALASGFGKQRAPRTAAERQLQFAESTLETNKRDAQAWTDYINALNLAGRYSEAARAYEDAIRSVPESEPVAYVKVAYARVLLAQKNTDEGLEQAQAALKTAEADRKRLQKKLVDEGVKTVSASYQQTGLGPVVEAQVLIASIYREQGRWQDVIEMSSKTLKVDPIASDVLLVRGRAYVETGDIDKARADFEQALKFGETAAQAELDKLEDR